MRKKASLGPLVLLGTLFCSAYWFTSTPVRAADHRDAPLVDGSGEGDITGRLRVHRSQRSLESRICDGSKSVRCTGAQPELSIFHGDADPFGESRTSGAGALSLGVCRSIVSNHGGAMRFAVRGGVAYFEVELPVVRTEAPADMISAGKLSGRSPYSRWISIQARSANCWVCSACVGIAWFRHRRTKRRTWRIGCVSTLYCGRCGCLRRAVRSGSEFQERARATIGAFGLVSDGYDVELARRIEQSGYFLLGRPIQESDLDRVLAQVDARSTSAARR